MNLLLPLLFVLVAYMFVIPQLDVKLMNTDWLGFMVMALFLVPLIVSFVRIKNTILNPNKEEIEIVRADLIKLFFSKKTLIIIGSWIAVAAAVIIYEMSTEDKGITLGKVHYSLDKLLLIAIIPILILALDETRRIYENAIKEYRPIKKKKNK